MSERDELSSIERLLPAGTARSWRILAPLIPDYAYLVGGTALTVHLQHRISRDLDFFTEAPFDPGEILSIIDGAGTFAPTLAELGTLNGVFDTTKIQFLDASTQTLLEEPTRLAGLRLAGLSDLMAMKLKVIQDRGALRDYFDIMCMETQAELSVDEGLGLLIARYNPVAPTGLIANVVRGLGYLGDVEDDPSLPLPRHDIEAYWNRRQPEIVKALGT